MDENKFTRPTNANSVAVLTLFLTLTFRCGAANFAMPKMDKEVSAV
jgi:hypothetical protein